MLLAAAQVLILGFVLFPSLLRLVCWRSWRGDQDLADRDREPWLISGDKTYQQEVVRRALRKKEPSEPGEPNRDTRDNTNREGRANKKTRTSL